jgi:copper chaperone
MSERTVKVPGITCGHCTATIERELGDLEGVTSVRGDPGAKTVTVAWELPATWATIAALLRDIGLPAAEE